MDAIRDFFTYVGNQLSSVELTDIIDIVIVAFFLYYLFKFVRDRRAGKLALGVLVLMLMLVVSNWLQMRVTNYILERVVDVGFIALIIVFQPELRSMLEKMGGESIKGIKSRFDRTSSEGFRPKLAELCYAAENLSASKTGALIVFERTTLLNDQMGTGTIVNADVTSELLRNIFFVKAPLHDGAVIIREGRIAAAGCMLPLTQNANLSSDLGMRHRAGIGMSEHSDAVVVIVSEETGSISVAIDGMLKRHLSADTFEKILRAELMPDGDEANGRGLVGLINSAKALLVRKNDKKEKE